jgi:hypothetical protein
MYPFHRGFAAPLGFPVRLDFLTAACAAISRRITSIDLEAAE